MNPILYNLGWALYVSEQWYVIFADWLHGLPYHSPRFAITSRARAVVLLDRALNGLGPNDRIFEGQART